MELDYLEMFDEYYLKYPNIINWEYLNIALKWCLVSDISKYLKIIFNEIKSPSFKCVQFPSINWYYETEPIDVDCDQKEFNIAIHEILINNNFTFLRTYWENRNDS